MRLTGMKNMTGIKNQKSREKVVIVSDVFC